MHGSAERLVKVCARRFRGNDTDAAARSMAIRAEALSAADEVDWRLHGSGHQEGDWLDLAIDSAACRSAASRHFTPVPGPDS
jgi:hypothetical protein